MKKRRLIALAAAAVMAASSLAGCGGSQTSSTTAAGSTAETAAASSNAVSPDAKSTDQTLGGGIAVGSSDGEAVKYGYFMYWIAALILSASSSLTRSLISSKPRSIAQPIPRPVLIRRSVMMPSPLQSAPFYLCLILCYNEETKEFMNC